MSSIQIKASGERSRLLRIAGVTLALLASCGPVAAFEPEVAMPARGALAAQPVLMLLAQAAAPPQMPGAKPQKLTVVGPAGPGAAPVPLPSSEVERYCLNIADQAQEARFALQTKQLRELEAQIEERIGELEEKRLEHQRWLERRQAFLEGTSTVVVDIYAKMRPDAAAQQLARIDREAAASVLTKLKSRAASAILSEMPTDVAASIAGIIVERTTGAGNTSAVEGKQS